MKEIKQAISLVIRNEVKQVLVVRRSPHKNTFPGHFSLPAANLNVGEDFKAAANRVARDKLGLTSVQIHVEPLAVSGVVDRPENLLKMFDYEVVNYKGRFLLNNNEYTEYTWMTSEDLMKYVEQEHDGVMGECTRNFLKSEGLLSTKERNLSSDGRVYKDMKSGNMNSIIMRRVYYSYGLSILGSVVFWQGVFLGASAILLAHWLHVASIVKNFLSVPVGQAPNYIINTFVNAATHGELLTVLTLILAVMVSVSIGNRLAHVFLSHFHWNKA